MNELPIWFVGAKKARYVATLQLTTLPDDQTALVLRGTEQVEELIEVLLPYLEDVEEPSDEPV